MAVPNVGNKNIALGTGVSSSIIINEAIIRKRPIKLNISPVKRFIVGFVFRYRDAPTPTNNSHILDGSK